MISQALTRTSLLLGEDGLDRLRRARVLLFGLGGVGGHAAEALARSGIGTLELVDDDRVVESNLNRQLFASVSTVGRYKTDAAAERLAEAAPDCRVVTRRCFYLPENAAEFDFSQYDYVVDAVDTVSAKLDIILQAKRAGVPVISCMGMGNKLDASAILVSDLAATSVCPLARIMRKELKKRGVEHVKVVWSREKPMVPKGRAEETMPQGAERGGTAVRRQTPGSCAFVPAAAGLILAGEVVRDLSGVRGGEIL